MSLGFDGLLALQLLIGYGSDTISDDSNIGYLVQSGFRIDDTAIGDHEIKFFSPCGDLLKSSNAISCIQELERHQTTSVTEERKAA